MLGRKICFLILFLFTNAFAQAPDFAADVKAQYDSSTEPASLDDFRLGFSCAYYCKGCEKKWVDFYFQVYTYSDVVGALEGKGPRYPKYDGVKVKEITGLVELGWNKSYRDAALERGDSRVEVVGPDLVWTYDGENFVKFRRSGPYINFLYRNYHGSFYYGYCWQEKGGT